LLQFLSRQPNIDPARIGVLGFSWDGLVSMSAAELLYSSTYGDGLTFKAHVAHYPVCYAWNNTDVLAMLGTTPAQFGVQWINLTGAPVLIEVGMTDGYDNGSGPCEALAASASSLWATASSPVPIHCVCSRSSTTSMPPRSRRWRRRLWPLSACSGNVMSRLAAR
jgi:dienelactone hydrolase